MAEDNLPVESGRDETDPAADTADDLNIAGHSGECPYGCPVCAAISVFKQMSPDVGTHLGAALREFMLAAKAFLDGVAEREPPEDREIERISLG